MKLRKIGKRSFEGGASLLTNHANAKKYYRRTKKEGKGKTSRHRSWQRSRKNGTKEARKETLSSERRSRCFVTNRVQRKMRLLAGGEAEKVKVNIKVEDRIHYVRD